MASVTFEVDAGKWLVILKGLSESLDEANLHFMPYQPHVFPFDSKEEEKEYMNFLDEQNELPVFKREDTLPGLNFVEMSSNNTTMTSLSLPYSFFDSFFVSKPTVVGINFSSKENGIVALLKPFLNSGNNLKVEVFDNQESPMIRHTIIEGRNVSKIDYNFLDIENEGVDLKNFECIGTVSFSSSSFKKKIETLKHFGDEITISFENLDEQKVTLECSESTKSKSIVIEFRPERISIKEEEIKEEHQDETEEFYLHDREDDQWGDDDIEFIGAEDIENEPKKKQKSSQKEIIPDCFDLISDSPKGDSFLSQELLSKGCFPMSPVIKFYWGNVVGLEQDLGNGGRVMTFIAEKVRSDEDNW